MSAQKKLSKKFFSNGCVSYKDAERMLTLLGFHVHISGSHHIFRKKGYALNVSLKRRPQLLSYQIKMVKTVLMDHGYGL